MNGAEQVPPAATSVKKHRNDLKCVSMSHLFLFDIMGSPGSPGSLGSRPKKPCISCIKSSWCCSETPASWFSYWHTELDCIGIRILVAVQTWSQALLTAIGQISGIMLLYSLTCAMACVSLEYGFAKQKQSPNLSRVSLAMFWLDT